MLQKNRDHSGTRQSGYFLPHYHIRLRYTFRSLTSKISKVTFPMRSRRLNCASYASRFGYVTLRTRETHAKDLHISPNWGLAKWFWAKCLDSLSTKYICACALPARQGRTHEREGRVHERQGRVHQRQRHAHTRTKASSICAKAASMSANAASMSVKLSSMIAKHAS